MSSREKILREIKKILKRCNMTQAQLAEKLGMTQPYLSRILNGKDPLTISRISQILGCLSLTEDDREVFDELMAEQLNEIAEIKETQGIECATSRVIDDDPGVAAIQYLFSLLRDRNHREQVIRLASKLLLEEGVITFEITMKNRSKS